MSDRSENVSQGTTHHVEAQCIPNMKSFPPIEAEKSVTKVFSPPAHQSPYYNPDFPFVKSGQKSFPGKNIQGDRNAPEKS